MSNLFDNTVGPPSTSTPSNAWSVGTCFTVSDGSAPITGLAWYRGATTSTAKPSNLRLYGTDTTVPLREFNGADIVDSGAVGWQVTPFATAYTPSSGVHYVAQMTWPGLNAWYFYSRSSLANPATPFAWDTAGVRRSTEFGSTYPGSQDDTLAWLVSPVWGGSTSGGGLTTGDLENALADWLINTSDNQHQTDGLPWLTKAKVDDTNTKVTSGLNLAGGLQALSDSLAHTLQMASDWLAAGSTTIFTDLKSRVIGSSGGGGSAFFGPGGTQVAAGVETLLAQNITLDDLGAAVALLRERLTLSPDLADTSRWTLVDTINGEGDALVELQADLYRVTIGDAPGTHGPQLVGGAEWRPRWGWIAPRVHGSYLQRQPLVDLSPIAIAPGLFMDGLLLYSHPGFTWVVEAFVLDRT